MEMTNEQMITEDDELIVPMSIEYREDMTADDLKELCRLCGNMSNQLMPIFAGEGLEHNLPDKIKEYLPVNVRAEIFSRLLMFIHQSGIFVHFLGIN